MVFNRMAKTRVLKQLAACDRSYVHNRIKHVQLTKRRCYPLNEEAWYHFSSRLKALQNYVVWGRRSVDAGGRWPPCLHSQSNWLATASGRVGRQQSCDVSQIRNALVVVVKPVRPSAADTNRASDCKLRQRRQHHQHCCIYNHGVLVASRSLGAYSAPNRGTEYSDEHVFLSVWS